MITANPPTYRVFVIGTLGAMLVLTASGWGQATINAQVTVGGGSGKCTFEVRVDGVADVQIRGNQGYLQTKAGMPAQWVRLKCNQPLPRNPNHFRFAGVDGRGQQYLLRDRRRTMASPLSASKTMEVDTKAIPATSCGMAATTTAARGTAAGGATTEIEGAAGTAEVADTHPRVAASGTTTSSRTARTTFATRCDN